MARMESALGVINLQYSYFHVETIYEKTRLLALGDQVTYREWNSSKNLSFSAEQVETLHRNKQLSSLCKGRLKDAEEITKTRERTVRVTSSTGTPSL